MTQKSSIMALPETLGPDQMLYVYRLPDKLSNGYCFGGWVPITFLNVDWFGGAPELPISDVVSFVKGKRYYDPTARFLVVGSAFAFTIEPVKR